MILIRTYNPAAIKRLLPDAGILLSQVEFNVPENDSHKVIVQVGGQGIHHTHCYVQQHYKIPIISCLDPASQWQDERNKVFIKIALHKAQQIDSGTSVPHSVPDSAIQIPTTFLEAYEGILHLYEADPLSIDIECNPDTHELTCIGLATSNRALVIPLQHEDQRYWSQDDEYLLWKALAMLLALPTLKLFQNYIFDCMILSKLGLGVNGCIYDTMTLAHLIQPEWPKGLSDLARLYLYCDVWKTQKDWTSNINLWRYNGRDAIYTHNIHTQQLKILTEAPKRLKLYNETLVPLHRQVLTICENGLTVDNDALKKLTEITTHELNEKLTSLQTATKSLIPPKVQYILRKGRIKPNIMYFKMGTHTYEPIDMIPYNDLKMLKKIPFEVYEKKVDRSPFNPGSSMQVKDLIRALGHPVPKRKDPETGEMRETADELALKKLIAKYKEPLYRDILSYREYAKLVGTYCHMLPDSDGKIRSNITVPGTVTSRFSSKQTAWGTGANLQNVPKNFRHVFVPSHPDYVMLNADFKQADPHVVAWLANEQTMLDIMDGGGDLHAHTGSAIAGRDITKDTNYNRETSIERKLGKACNNALNYGMGAERFSNEVFKQLGIIITIDQAKDMIAAYFKLYPNIKKWHRKVEAEVYSGRRLQTPMGRVRYFHRPMDYKMVQDALAYIPPTTVSDAINMGWLRFESQKGALCATVLQQCHDSLLLEVHKDDVDAAKQLMVKCMEGVTFVVNDIERHFECDITIGTNWGFK